MRASIKKAPAAENATGAFVSHQLPWPFGQRLLIDARCAGLDQLNV
jgi:hypothetical protein